MHVETILDFNVRRYFQPVLHCQMRHHGEAEEDEEDEDWCWDGSVHTRPRRGDATPSTIVLAFDNHSTQVRTTEYTMTRLVYVILIAMNVVTGR